jgi:hypothetical protein
MRAAMTIVLLLTLGCSTGTMSVETLYFGTEVDGVRVVNDVEWERFLADAVTPRFPGFTEWPARGHWKAEQEPSYVLQIACEPTPANERAIEAIIAEYRQRFRQEAVMRMRERARVGF